MHQFKQVDIYHLLFENPLPSNRAALIDSKTGEQVDKTRLHQIILNVAKYLKFHLQLLPGQVVAIYAPNSLSYVYAIFGILAAGGIVTLANPAYTSSELSFQLKDSNAHLVFTMASLRKVVEEACSKRIILLDDLANLVEKGIYNKDWRPLKLTPTEVKEKVAFLCYSSGTTGLPKGVELTHWNVSANVQQISAFEGSPLPDEVWIGVLPFYHVYGLSLSIHTSLFQGIPLVVMQRFELVHLLETLQKYQVTLAHLVPPILIALAKHPIVDEYDLSKLREIFSGAAPLSAEIAQAIQARFPGCQVRQGYGMTEMSPVTHITPKQACVLGSVGQLLPGCEAKIVNEAGMEVAVGEVGELLLRGPNRMKGYLNNDKANAETINSDGFLRSGDVARMDKLGNYYIVDRFKELIKYKGFQVAPAELEKLLLTHALVNDAAVVGVERDYAELPKAFIVLKPGSSCSPEDIHQFVNTRVAPFKRLRGGIEFISEVPRSASGKILRRVLKQQEKNKAKL